MKQYSPKQTAAMKARVRRLRAQYRKRMIAAIIIFFILGIVAGVFAHRWYVDRNPDMTEAGPLVTPPPAATEEAADEATPEPEATPEAWAMDDDGSDDEGGIFLEDAENKG